MEERLVNHKPSGLSSSALKNWGMIFVALGIIGRSILQNRMLGMGNSTTMELLDLMTNSGEAMTYATIAIVLRAVETCAVPIYAFLLVEGFKHTSDFKKYLLRMVGLAAVSEIPYNLAMSGTLLNMDTRNPVFGLVLALVMLYFYNRYTERSFKNIVVKLVITVAGFLWASMLRIECGAALLLVTAVLWAMRKKPNFRGIVGCSAALCCTLFSAYYLASPMSFLAIHFYNEEKGSDDRIMQYLAYPVILLAVGLIGMFAF